MPIRRHLPARTEETPDETRDDFANARERVFDQAAAEINKAFADVKRTMDTVRAMINGMRR